MFKKFFTLIFSIVLLSCGSAQQQISVPGGNPANYSHLINATVGLVVVTRNNQVTQPYCTAFFVGPRLLATANHCVQDSVDFAMMAGRSTIENTVGRTIYFISYSEEESWLNSNNQERIFRQQPTFHFASVVAVDTTNDSAMLLLAGHEPDWSDWYQIRDISRIQVVPGEIVYSIGHPLHMNWSLSTGMVSRISRYNHNTSVRIRHQTNIGPGSSGSALLDAQGRVIGINVAVSDDYIMSFAVPINYFQVLLRNYHGQTHN